MSRGYAAIGVYQPRVEANIGTLLRAAYLYDAAYVFTIGARYSRRQATDTPDTQKHVPLFHYADFDDFFENLPAGASLVGLELHTQAVPIQKFQHPERAVYILGAEDRGLPADILDACEHIVQIPTPKPQSMNLSAAGSIALYTRHVS